MKKLTKEQMEIVKLDHPEWFNGVEVGKWYRGVGNKLICITNLPISNHASAYGFSGNKGKWYNDDGSYSWLVNDLKEATPEEVKQALIAEAKRRYKEGDNIECVIANYDVDFIDICGNFHFENNKLFVDKKFESGIWHCLFKDGQWASVIPQEKPSLQDDIQALKDRWPNINFTVIEEGKK